MITPCSCQPPASKEFPFCPRCRGAVGAGDFRQYQAVSESLGIQTGDNACFTGNFAGGDLVTPDNFGYREMEMSRADTTKAWLPDNWLAAAAAGASILGVFLNLNLNHQSWSLGLTVALLVPALVSCMVLVIRSRVAQSGAMPIFGRVFEEGPDGELYQSTPVGTCPQCGRGMTVQRVPTNEGQGYQWVCSSGITRHCLWFDPTEFNKVSW